MAHVWDVALLFLVFAAWALVRGIFMVYAWCAQFKRETYESAPGVAFLWTWGTLLAATITMYAHYSLTLWTNGNDVEAVAAWSRWVQYTQVTLPSWLVWTGFALGMGICIPLGWIHYSLGKNWSAVIAVRRDHELVTSGLYAVARHPMYTVFLLQVPAVFLTCGNLMVTGTLLVLTVYVVGRYKEEEGKLEELFGEQYRRYRRHTGAFCPLACNAWRCCGVATDEERAPLVGGGGGTSGGSADGGAAPASAGSV